jgi:hypothetical protein
MRFSNSRQFLSTFVGYFRPAANGIILIFFASFPVQRIAMQISHRASVQAEAFGVEAQLKSLSQVSCKTVNVVREHPESYQVRFQNVENISSQMEKVVAFAYDSSGRILDSLLPISYNGTSLNGAAKRSFPMAFTGIDASLVGQIASFRIRQGFRWSHVYHVSPLLGVDLQPIGEHRICADVQVRNRSDRFLESVRFRVDLLDSTGRLFHSDAGSYSPGHALLPGDSVILRQVCESLVGKDLPAVRSMVLTAVDLTFPGWPPLSQAVPPRRFY